MTAQTTHPLGEITCRVTGSLPVDPAERAKVEAALAKLVDSLCQGGGFRPPTAAELHMRAAYALFAQGALQFDPDDGTDYAAAMVEICRKVDADLTARTSGKEGNA